MHNAGKLAQYLKKTLVKLQSIDYVQILAKNEHITA